MTETQGEERREEVSTRKKGKRRVEIREGRQTFARFSSDGSFHWSFRSEASGDGELSVSQSRTWRMKDEKTRVRSESERAGEKGKKEETNGSCRRTL